ncbi:carbohydrate-binding module family 5 protein [Paxillus involutus ATCC 200175]|nr:carbohydrate-binding module family 5 protein [Paxillus involutus ATCC 200175]
MIPSTFFTAVVVFSSFLAVNAVALRRDSAVTAHTPTTYSATPYTDPTSPTVAKRATVTCDGYQLWQANLAYSAGNNVIFNGELYTANQWTYNNSPGTNPGQWTADGNCAQPVNNKANCNGIAAWQQSKAYTGGNEVVYVNHLWVANQWTESNTPGDFSGTWRDAGVCA